MPLAFVLITTDVGAEWDVIRRLRKVPNVKEAYASYGFYDIIAKVEAESIAKLKENIVKHIRLTKNVHSTSTMIVSDG